MYTHTSLIKPNKKKNQNKNHSKSKPKKKNYQTKIASSGILLHLGKSRAHRNQNQTKQKKNLYHLLFFSVHFILSFCC